MTGPTGSGTSLQFAQTSATLAIPLDGTETVVLAIVQNAAANNRVKVDVSMQSNVILSSGNQRLDLRMRLYRDGVLLTEYRSESNFAGNDGNQRFIICSTYVDTPLAGVHTYQLRVAVITATNVSSVTVETRAMNNLITTFS
ncbi:hypothetical protein D3P09_18500 [Paenibacillus pinisoli]|uniref:Exosporium protein C n=1 Tax=Paenibacillus pinisoli TaxID=1276110 RepID=A0A3A6PQB7_9BACL|nr:hypothetical protein D3P09_18500 [Paenibacillus pinisoli]